jgi:hypothetical protein
MTAQKYDQAFFLDLAEKGKDTWNAWRLAYKDVRVTFAGVDFSVAPLDQIDFAGYEFGDYADFSYCKWRGCNSLREKRRFPPGRARFSFAKFGASANFTGANFGLKPTFFGAEFGDRAKFIDATVGAGAYFEGVAFGKKADFLRATFASAPDDGGINEPQHSGLGDPEDDGTDEFEVGAAKFNFATFGDKTTFKFAAFESGAQFRGTGFGWQIDFSEAHFKDYVNFEGMNRDAWNKEFETMPAIINRRDTT